MVSGVITYRIFLLSVVRHNSYARTAKAQSENISNVLARGNIYIKDQNDNFLVATNKKFPVAYVVPAWIEEDKNEEISGKLSEILGIEKEEIKSKIGGESENMKVLARRISNEQVSAIKELGIRGANISYELDRFYPLGDTAANVLGFLGYDPDGKRAGQYGIEGYYNEELFGQTSDALSLFESVRVFDVINNIVGKTASKSEEAEQKGEPDVPADVILTIDKNIQTLIETELNELMAKWQPEQATIIIQEPTTGKILAMANRPTFNPNTYYDSDTKTFLDAASQEMFEPGSSFKSMTMAIGLDLAKIDPDTKYDDPGIVNISGYDIGNFDRQSHGTKTMTEVLEKSLNTGTMFVQDLIGNDEFLNYIINMGFGQASGIDMPGEVPGDITNLYSGRKINFLTASFGQGIAVTPIQLINAYSMIANGGKLMRPYIVEKIVKENGEETVTEPEVITIPISEKTSIKLKRMLVSVVDNGFDKARIKGYDVAGKTGTAQISNPDGGYLEGQFIHNLVGFAPAYDPKFVVFIKIEKPKNVTYASESLTPSFKKISEYLLTYLKVPPTR